MKIKLIVIGKYKENYLKELERFYLKRSFSCEIKIIELPDYEDSPRSTLLEAQEVLKVLEKNENIIILDIAGKQRHIQNVLSADKVNTIIIGGSNGLHENIKKIAHHKITLSKLTFPHQLARLIVLDLLTKS